MDVKSCSSQARGVGGEDTWTRLYGYQLTTLLVRSTLIISHPKELGKDPIPMSRAIAHEKIVKMTGVLFYGGVCSGGIRDPGWEQTHITGSSNGQIRSILFYNSLLMLLNVQLSSCNVYNHAKGTGLRYAMPPVIQKTPGHHCWYIPSTSAI
jgi:hypothetical protein